MSTASRLDLLRELEPVVGEAGLDLEDLQVTPAGRRRLLRVVVDRDGGVSLDDAAALSTRLSAHLDASDVMGSAAYVLEVTSPGVDRPLDSPRRWRRARGRLVTVALDDGGQLVGRVGAVADDRLVLDADGQERVLRWDQVRSGRVQVEFSRPSTDGIDAGEPVDEEA